MYFYCDSVVGKCDMYIFYSGSIVGISEGAGSMATPPVASAAPQPAGAPSNNSVLSELGDIFSSVSAPVSTLH